MYAPVLHKSPRKPDSHPVKHVPLMWEHWIMSRHWPHVSLQLIPYDPFLHTAQNKIYLKVFLLFSLLKKTWGCITLFFSHLHSLISKICKCLPWMCMYLIWDHTCTCTRIVEKLTIQKFYYTIINVFSIFVHGNIN